MPKTCAICTDAHGPVCSKCSEDWGAIVATIDRWQKWQSNTEKLEARVKVLLNYLCDQRGLSEVQAAKLLGVSRPTVRAWRGK
jgi:hypothetical protein